MDMNIDIQISIYFKELPHMLMGPGKSEICRLGWQSGSTDRISVLRQNSFSRKPRSFVLIPSNEAHPHYWA